MEKQFQPAHALHYLVWWGWYKEGSAGAKTANPVLTAAELDKIDYISIDIYAELPEGMAGTDFYFYNQIMGWIVEGANTFTITGAQFKAQMEGASTAALPAYNSETGWAFFQIANAGVTLYFDNCFAVYK